jgi:hypothetical protein
MAGQMAIVVCPGVRAADWPAPQPRHGGARAYGNCRRVETLHNAARDSHLGACAMTETALNVTSFLFLGFFLGMRHATDADHVVAIATIVSRERSVAGSALIGAAWGVGHTITVMAVGAAIIVFGVVIPPQLGLSMEFAVGIMLVLLGVLTLTGMGRAVGAAHTHPGVPADMRSSPTITCMRMATTCTGTRTVTFPVRTGTSKSTHRWRGSTAVGSDGWRTIRGCAPSWSASCTALQDRPPSP